MITVLFGFLVLAAITSAAALFVLYHRRVLAAMQEYEDMIDRYEEERARIWGQAADAEQKDALRALAAGIKTHNSTPVTPENLRYAATHEALCRSWIFDVLTGLADALEG